MNWRSLPRPAAKAASLRRARGRFFSKIATPDGQDGCWTWQGQPSPSGYGTFTVGMGNRSYAHRYSYELFVGPIPDGLTIDHLCRNRICVNPAHLEPVTNAENVRRGTRWATARTHCGKGHPYTGKSKSGRNVCRTCARDSEAAYRERRRSAVTVWAAGA